jgi:hypothetical protein
MSDYEFRFYRDGALAAIHITAIDNDSAACERARNYLFESAEFELVEVRCGLRFMQKIAAD